MLRESVDGLDIQPDGIYIDVTYGGGGHSREILRRLGPDGRLLAFDQDADAEQNIVGDERLTFVRSNFRYLYNWARYHGIAQIDGLIADLGMSSHHVDDGERGFSFRANAPLDMRMNQRAGRTAADIIADYSEEQLAQLFYLYGEMRQSRKIAATIVRHRATDRILTTGQLMKAVEPVVGSIERPNTKKDLARLFQALRIEVNHELEALSEMLSAATRLLRPGGRLSVITYHSLEDRMVKNLMKAGNTEGHVEQDFYGRRSSPFRLVNNRPITPTDEEIAENPRSRSAKLRVAEKVQEE